MRRIGMAVALMGAALASTFVAASPAQAAPPGCHDDLRIKFSAGVLLVFNNRFCRDPDRPPDSKLPIVIEREVPGDFQNPPFWVTVAIGNGSASYTCNGTTPTVYRVNFRSAGVLACG